MGCAIRTEQQEQQQDSRVYVGNPQDSERGLKLEAAQEEDRVWREERREQVVASLRRAEGRYDGITDFLTRLGIVMGIVFLMGVLTIIVLAGLGGAHLAQAGLLLMGVGIAAVVVLAGIGSLCHLAWARIKGGYGRWAHWQAIDLEASPDEKRAEAYSQTDR